MKKNAHLSCERKPQRRETSHFVNGENEKDLFTVSASALPMAKLNSEKVERLSRVILKYLITLEKNQVLLGSSK